MINKPSLLPVRDSWHEQALSRRRARSQCEKVACPLRNVSWPISEDFRELASLLHLVQERKFQLIIDRSSPLAEARAAQRHLEGRGHFGKVVLKMS
jgi:NADPH:quinone reductase-like Zn-dependent oxidoreductase